MTRRQPDREERRDVEYGETVARALAGMDLGQTAVVKHRAAVALEAMEGTDETIRRAGRIAGPGTTVVKVSKPRQDMRFDVPVVGAGTLDGDARGGRAGARASTPGARCSSTAPAFLARAEADGVAVLGLDPARAEGAEAWLTARCGRASSAWARSAATTRGCGRSLPGARLVGVYDTDAARAAEVAAEHGCRAFADAASLLAEVRRRLGRRPDRRPPRGGPPRPRGGAGTSCSRSR